MNLDDLPFLDANARREFAMVLRLMPDENGFVAFEEGKRIQVSDARAFAMFLQRNAAIPEKTTMKVLESLALAVEASKYPIENCA